MTSCRSKRVWLSWHAPSCPEKSGHTARVSFDQPGPLPIRHHNELTVVVQRMPSIFLPSVIVLCLKRTALGPICVRRFVTPWGVQMENSVPPMGSSSASTGLSACVLTSLPNFGCLASAILASNPVYRTFQEHPHPIVDYVAYNLVGPALLQRLRFVRCSTSNAKPISEGELLAEDDTRKTPVDSLCQGGWIHPGSCYYNLGRYLAFIRRQHKTHAEFQQSVSHILIASVIDVDRDSFI